MQVEKEEKPSERKPIGHRIPQLPIGRTKTYELIGEGKLDARKCGNATIILNWDEYAASLPKIGDAA